MTTRERYLATVPAGHRDAVERALNDTGIDLDKVGERFVRIVIHLRRMSLRFAAVEEAMETAGVR